MYKSGEISGFDDSVRPEWANGVEIIDNQMVVELANGDQMALEPITGPGPKIEVMQALQQSMKGANKIPIYQISHYYITISDGSKRDIISDNSSFEIDGELIPATYFFSFEGRASGHIVLHENRTHNIRRLELLFSPTLETFKKSDKTWSPLDTAFGIRTVLLHEMGHGRSYKDMPLDIDNSYKSLVLLERAANTNLVAYLREIGVRREEIIKMLDMAYSALNSYDNRAESNLRLFISNTPEANEEFIVLSKQLLEDLFDDDMYPVSLEKLRSATKQTKGSIILLGPIEVLNTGVTLLNQDDLYEYQVVNLLDDFHKSRAGTLPSMPTGRSSRQTWRKLREVMDIYNDKKELLLKKLIEKTQIQDSNLTDIEEKTKKIYQLLEEQEKREKAKIRISPF